MSFLKKHWRFTVPAAVVLCVLLLGVVLLYSTSEPHEPKTVYVMPERTVAVAPATTPTESVYQPETIQTSPASSATSEASDDISLGEAADELTLSDAECCPDESVLSGDTENLLLGLTEEDIARYEAIERKAAWLEKSDGYMAEMDTIDEEKRKLALEESQIVDWETFDYDKLGEFLQTKAGKRVVEISKKQVELSNRLIELSDLLDPANAYNDL